MAKKPKYGGYIYLAKTRKKRPGRHAKIQILNTKKLKDI